MGKQGGEHLCFEASSGSIALGEGALDEPGPGFGEEGGIREWRGGLRRKKLGRVEGRVIDLEYVGPRDRCGMRRGVGGELSAKRRIDLLEVRSRQLQAAMLEGMSGGFEHRFGLHGGSEEMGPSGLRGGWERVLFEALEAVLFGGVVQGKVGLPDVWGGGGPMSSERIEMRRDGEKAGRRKIGVEGLVWGRG